MQLPVDVKALIDEATNIAAARETPLSVSVYIDDSAPAELIAHVRSAFASSNPQVRMTVSYLDKSFIPHPTDDIAVIVAGSSKAVGASAAAIRAVGVPVMVATSSPADTRAVAQANGEEIPDGDVVAPAGDGEAEEPLALDDAAMEALDERMGRWIVSVCREKRLAFAIAFPFMRRSLAKDAVQTTAFQNAGVGLIPILPGADLPIMTLNQAKMALQIAAAYGQEMNTNRLKELAAVVGGAYLSRSVARKLIGAVPLLGFIIKPGIAYGTTTAVGYAIVEYFEGGEDATGVANVLERATAAGSKFVSAVQEKAAEVVPTIMEALPAQTDR